MLQTALYSFPAFRYPFPFEHGSERELFTSICKGEYTIPEFLPEEIHALLSAILTKNPVERISLTEIMVHPWCLASPDELDMASDVTPATTAVLPPRKDEHADQDRGTTLVPFLDRMHALDALRSVHSVSGSPFERADTGAQNSPHTG